MINWDRTFLRKRLGPAIGFVITLPTLIIWGDRDAYAGPELADRGAACARPHGSCTFRRQVTGYTMNDRIVSARVEECSPIRRKA
jgi:pimeloyl-ACP methyl ester carboxylesterase